VVSVQSITDEGSSAYVGRDPFRCSGNSPDADDRRAGLRLWVGRLASAVLTGAEDDNRASVQANEPQVVGDWALVDGLRVCALGICASWDAGAGSVLIDDGPEVSA